MVCHSEEWHHLGVFHLVNTMLPDFTHLLLVCDHDYVKPFEEANETQYAMGQFYRCRYWVILALKWFEKV